MKKILMKLSLTVCAVALMAAPVPAFAAGGSGAGSQCNKTANTNCTVKNCIKTDCNQSLTQLQNLLQDKNYNQLYQKYINNQNNKDNANCQKNSCNLLFHWNCNGNNDSVVKPDAPDTDTNKPNTNKPDTNKPNTNKPDADQPNQDQNQGNQDQNGNNNQNNQNNGNNQDNNQNNGSGNDNSDVNIGSYAQQVANIVNQERAKNGLSALKVNTKLSSVATKKAADMRDNNYFSHTSPTYGSPFDMMKQFGISYSSAGENIAEGQKTPDSVMNAWMNSEGHRANILNSNFTEIGVGYVTDSKGNTYWVQMFIRP